MYLRDKGWCGMDWTDQAQDSDQWRALVNVVMNLRVTLNVGKSVSSCTTGGFSRRAQLHGVSYLCQQTVRPRHKWHNTEMDLNDISVQARFYCLMRTW
jgi:hypothetical protein